MVIAEGDCNYVKYEVIDNFMMKVIVFHELNSLLCINMMKYIQ